LRPPCEVVVRSVLPAFRSLVARNLIENFNFSQVAAAKKLGTTQASISHYIYSKRGEKMVEKLEASRTVKKIVDEVAKGIAENKITPLDAMFKFCKLCEALRTGDLICDWHKDCLDIPNTCNICPTS
jgi:predicted transcriptional regulator